MKIFIFVSTLLFWLPSMGQIREVKVVKEVRVYMPITWPVDPANIVTNTDMDLSYALAATLVQWGKNKQKVSGLALKWEAVGEKTYRFFLRENAKWSDGSKLTSQDVKRSIERGIKFHPSELRSLSVLLEAINCPSDHEIDFLLKKTVTESNLLGKLTEPNYGIIHVKSDESLDLSKTSGAFWMEHQSPNDLSLKRNPNWFDFSPEMPEVIHIKQSPPHILNQQSVLLDDKWPNLIQVPSIISQELMLKYETEKFEVWKRPTDRIFAFILGKRNYSQEGLNLLLFLKEKLNRQKIVSGLSGYSLADQMFPTGYQLHDSKFKSISATTAKIPETFKNRPLEILYSPARVSEQLKENIKKAVTDATGIEPKFINSALQEIYSHYKIGDYDLYAGTAGLADPDPEGAMSFYFENDFKIIPSIGNDFIHDLDQARHEQNPDKKFSLMHAMLTKAFNHGHFLPLFHCSTIGIGRHEIDLSHVPLTDETVTLSRIRFR